MKPYYSDDACTIYHGDCRDVLPSLEPVSVVMTDPPYGIDWCPRVNHIKDKHLWHDDRAIDLSVFLDLCDYQLFFGGQYFAHQLPTSPAWLAWIKRPLEYDFSQDRRSYATIELAWSNFPIKACFKCIVWDGGKRAGDPQNRTFEHPSQKPIELMRWCVSKAPSGVILDPFMGSGTTLRAAKDLGRKAIGIEIEEKYCEIAVKRLRQEVLLAG